MDSVKRTGQPCEEYECDALRYGPVLIDDRAAAQGGQEQPMVHALKQTLQPRFRT
jgi:hypothetical protein